MKEYNKNELTEYLTATRFNWIISKKCEFLNESVAFDIETTSTYIDNEKCAYMYVWQFGIRDLVIYGRTWAQFDDMINTFVECLGISENRKMVIYVHNLSFEFGFICSRYKWQKVFCVKSRTPVYAETENGFVFRCSYLLTNYSLDSVGKNLENPIPKLTGDLDYSLIRHSDTPLTDTEKGYIEHDILIVLELIREKIKQDGNITKIPLTNTGYVRQNCRKNCITSANPSSTAYKTFMRHMTITPEEYAQMVRAFQGGFTHASNQHSGVLLDNVTSFDMSSAYPSVLVGDFYPMGKGVIVHPSSIAELEELCERYLLIMDVSFNDICPAFIAEHYISFSKCFNVSDDVITDNGRIVSASHIMTTITSVDYEIIKKTYRWKNINVGTVRRYNKGYLPTSFIKTVLQFYQNKTTLKDVQGKEVEYMHSKQMLNSLYGMAVTSLVKENETYIGGEWTTENPIKADAIKHLRQRELSPDERQAIEEDITKSNEDTNRFLFYGWGIFCTAYCRRNLWDLIIETGKNGDFVYSDTDSVKILNAERYTNFISEWNKTTIVKMERACKHHNIPVDSVRPKTIKGKEKPLGIFENDGIYNRFKTYGAKRYMYETDGNINMTVSGVNKKKAIPYLKSISKDNTDVFALFEDGLQIPPEHTGKLTHTYIDREMTGTITDYLGNVGTFKELSGVHLENAPFEMGISADYLNYLLSELGTEINEREEI